MDLPRVASTIQFPKVLLPLRRNSSSPSTIRTLSAPRRSSIQCNALTLVSEDNNSQTQKTDRQIVAKYEPSIWPDNYLQSLNSEYKEEIYQKQHQVLKEEVRKILSKVENDDVDKLDLIDVLQRLGVAYHFKSEIRNILDTIHNIDYSKKKKTLHATALEFRILRHNGYHISTDVFIDFLDEMKNFKISSSVDIEGVLSLYEASFYSWEGETILDEARDFT
ncbi:hypothetical protein PIB30_020934 [Stylosanthes scabra]|uniref:Terpene synthase N-terminal domain-containing protein n=1 Tax=Stylosanthes scabra TaxID=79078 RepID=A0ABU6Q9S6_9FABA|nr:hypothetical protein [Stylosanthes scabra]